VLFALGVLGVLARRNAIVMFMSVELMLERRQPGADRLCPPAAELSGQVFVFFIIGVAAAEVAVGLALIVAIFKTKHSIDVDQVSGLRG
jgi:NADH-quinone oxidoreductase subunit K